MIFYDNLSKLCEVNGMTVSGLLSELQMSASNKQKWQNGATVNSNVLSKIADYFKVSTDYLLGRTDNPNITGKVYKNGNGIQAIGKNWSQVTVTQPNEPQDENQEELLKRFKMLDYEDKIEIMQMIIQKTKMKGEK